MSTHIPSSEALKDKAKVVRKFIKEKCNANISHSHSLELVSQLFGFRDWNTASAATKPKADQVSLPIHIETVADMKRALELFKDTDTIDADFEFKIKDILENLDESDSPEDTIHQEFSMSFEQFNDDIVSFKLALKNEDIYSTEEHGFMGRTLR